MNKAIRFFQILLQRIIIDHLPHISAALTFTSLLAIVPLFAISVAMINQIPVAHNYLAIGQDYIFQIFAPEFSQEAKNYLLEFVTKTQNLTKIGIVAIAITALLTLDTIEKTFNKIWHVRTSRNILMRFLSYLIIIVLGPVLIGVSLSVTTYFSTLALFDDNIAIGKLRYYMFLMLPLFTTVIAFTLMYKLVPNTRVPFSHALSGGVIAALLFEMAKSGFAFFITSFSSYQLIYGALAVIPITLIWIYVSWLIVLIGAEVTASLSDYQVSKTSLKTQFELDLCSAIKIVADIGFINLQLGVSIKQIMTDESQISVQQLESFLTQLERNDFIYQENELWYLSEEKSSYSIQKLLVICYPCSHEMRKFSTTDIAIENKIQKALSKIYKDIGNSKPILIQYLYE